MNKETNKKDNRKGEREEKKEEEIRGKQRTSRIWSFNNNIEMNQNLLPMAPFYSQ